MILSSVLMLKHLGEHEKAQKLEQAVQRVTKRGEVLTPDLGGQASTLKLAQEIAKHVG